MNNNILKPIDPVLIVENDIPFIRKISSLLGANGIMNIQICGDAGKIKSDMRNNRFNYSFILLNLSLPGIVEEGIAADIIENHPKIPVIVISSDDNLLNAIQYMKQGVLYYYNYKKVDFVKLAVQISFGIELYESIKPIITRSKKMRFLFRDIGKIAPTHKHILLRGETGVGKELFSEAIHKLSGRKGILVRVNIASISDAFFSDVLFGHKKGSFTDAREDRKGLIKECEGGTLLLDEISDLGFQSQQILLRLLKYGTYSELGSEEEIKLDSRIIATTNGNIELKIQKARYGADFLERLNAFPIEIPPLRERKEDIPLLVEYFLGNASGDTDLVKPIPTNEFIEKLIKHDFRGNIRELEDLIKRLIFIYPGCGKLTAEMLDEIFENEDVQSYCSLPLSPIISGLNSNSHIKIYPNFLEIEAAYYKEVLLRANGNQSKAANIAGLERRTFNNRLSSIKEKLRNIGMDIGTIPPLSDLLNRFH